MRRGALAVLLLTAAAAQLAAAADDARLQVEIEGPDSLERAAHFNVPVRVTLPLGGAAPLMLTPSVEGSALEVVRGRLIRSDAKPVDATQLRFELPVVARSEGTAILQIEVNTYVCEPRCRAVSARASRVFRVR